MNRVTYNAAANHGLIPELYNTYSSAGPIGGYTGSIPMVGFGAGAYLSTLLDRAELYEHTDCGALGVCGRNSSPG